MLYRVIIERVPGDPTLKVGAGRQFVVFNDVNEEELIVLINVAGTKGGYGYSVIVTAYED